MIWFFLFLAVLQGVTEFLPISSSGHLAYFQNLDFFQDFAQTLGKEAMFTYDVFLHLGTLFSIIIFFWKDIIYLIKHSVLFIVGKRADEQRSSFRLAIWIIIANIPIALLGLFFKDDISALFSSSQAIAVFFIINGILLISTRFVFSAERQLADISGWRALLVGLFQALAVLPGVSRAGATISSAMWLKIKGDDATRFSFLLGLPAILGASLLEVYKISQDLAGFIYGWQMIAGMVVAFATGVASLKLLVWVVTRTKLYPFGIYTLILGIVTLLVL